MKRWLIVWRGSSESARLRLLRSKKKLDCKFVSIDEGNDEMSLVFFTQQTRQVNSRTRSKTVVYLWISPIGNTPKSTELFGRGKLIIES